MFLPLTHKSYGTIYVFLEVVKLEQNEEEKEHVRSTLESVLCHYFTDLTTC
jgi:hypothetical protein